MNTTDKNHERLLNEIKLLKAKLNESSAKIHILEKTVNVHEIINKLNEAANNGESLNSIIQLLSRLLHDKLKPSSITLYEISEDKKFLIFKSKNSKIENFKNKVERIIGTNVPDLVKIPLKGENIYSKIIKGKKPVLHNNRKEIIDLAKSFTSNKILIKLIPKLIDALKLKSVINIPLVIKDEVIGLFDISSTKMYDAEIFNSLKNISNQLSAILHRKQIEEKTKNNEERLQLAIESAGLGIWDYNYKSGEIHRNRKWSEMLGYSQNEIKSNIESWKNLIHKDDILKTINNIDDHENNITEYFDIEHRLRTKHGDYKWIKNVGKIIDRDNNGNPIRALGFHQDIDDTKYSILKLIQSEKLNRDILKNTSDAVYLIDEKGNFSFVSQNAEVNFGFSKYELKQMGNINKLFGRSFYNKSALEKKGELKNIERSIIDKNGHLHHLIINVKKVEMESSNILVTCRDITDRVNTEYRYQTMYNNTPVMLHSIDHNGNLTNISDYWLEIMGYERDEVIGNKSTKFLTSQSRKYANEISQPIFMQKGYVKNVLYQMVKKNGEIIDVLHSAIAEHDENRKIVGSLAVLIDITEKKKAEEEIKYRLDFEKIISEISTKFINLPVEKIDHGIDEALKIIGEFVGADRSYVFQFEDDNKFISNTNKWCAKGIKPQIQNEKNIELDKTMPWISKKIRNKEVVHIPSIEDLPLEAKAEKEFFEMESIQSTVCVQMTYGQNHLGFVGFDAVTDKKDWTSDCIQLLGMVGEMICNGLIRKRTVESLRASEEKYRLISETSGDLITVFDMNGKVTFVNSAVEKMHGYQPKEILAMNMEDFVTKGSLNEARQIFTDALSGKIVRGEIQVLHKKGHEFPVSFSIAPIKHDSQVIGLVSISRDITERKKAEEALKESKERFELAMDAAQDGLYDWNLITNEIYFSPGWKRMLGYEGDELSNDFSVWETLTHPEDVKKAWKLQNELITKKRDHFEMEFQMKHKEGHWVDIFSRANAYFNKNEEAIRVVGVVQDITNRKIAEEEIKRSKEQMRQLTANIQNAREEERTAIAREIHDELGQVLTAIKMDLSWLLKRVKEQPLEINDKIQSSLRLINNSIQTVKRISSDLRPAILDDLGLAAAIEWQCEEFQIRTGININSIINLENIILDKNLSTAIFRIFQEAMTNIARHSKASKARIHLIREYDYVKLIIKDNGIGITRNQRDDIKSFGISGIKERADFFGGKTYIEGINSKGTTITIQIPVNYLKLEK